MICYRSAMLLLANATSDNPQVGLGFFGCVFLEFVIQGFAQRLRLLFFPTQEDLLGGSF